MTQTTWRDKLHPSRFSAMSGTMAALVGAVTGQAYVDRPLRRIQITSDGCVLAEATGDIGANDWIGAVSDWDRNWNTLLDAADLTPDERQAADVARRQVTTDWRVGSKS